MAGSPLDAFPALMDTLIGGHYVPAEALCDSISRLYPAAPASIYARIAVLYARMIDYEDSSGWGEFQVLVDSCITACSQRSPNPAQRVTRHFIKGSAHSAHGLILVRGGSVIRGLRMLMKARGEFDAAIELDPQFYDAYVGRGAYRYAVAQYASLLRWLPFVPSKQSGLEDLWTGVRLSRFSTFSALSSMVWLIMDDGDYVLADSICRAGLERFPNSRPFLWPLLSLNVRQANWTEAERIAAVLLAQYLDLPGNNGYETTGLYARLMQCADALGRPADAVAYAEQGLAAFRTPDAERRRADKLAAFRQRVNQ